MLFEGRIKADHTLKTLKLGHHSKGTFCEKKSATALCVLQPDVNKFPSFKYQIVDLFLSLTERIKGLSTFYLIIFNCAEKNQKI